MPLRAIAAYFRAAADDTRLEILGLLDRHGELCVCDLVEALGVTQSKASRHLRYLASRGLLDDRRDGLWVHYRIRHSLDPAAAAVLAAIRQALPEERLAALDRRLGEWRASKAPRVPVRLQAVSPVVGAG